MKRDLLLLIGFALVALILVSSVSYSGYRLYQGFENPIGETNSRGTFTLYYADWCPHCKSIKPEFQKLADKGTLSLSDKSTVAVKMFEEKSIPAEVKPNIKGYPTLLYSDTAGNIVEFNGERSPSGYLEFLNTQILGN
jgi:thiol-disulfide isomerase/thioredoxin